jgi:hypothetical protein
LGAEDANFAIGIELRQSSTQPDLALVAETVINELSQVIRPLNAAVLADGFGLIR